MSKLVDDVRKLVSVTRQEGVAGATRMAALAVRGRLMDREDRRIDEEFGLDTHQSVALGDLGIEGASAEAGFDYVPSHARIVRTFMGNLPGDLRDSIFVDFGSGKGRVLLLASLYKFSEIIGVEFSSDLHGAALDNISRFSHVRQRCRTIRCVNADASTFAIPHQRCVLYFNNPFSESVMAKVMKNMENAHRQSGCKMYVLYHQLTHEPESDRTENLTLLSEASFLRERPVRFPSLWTRFLLGSHTLRLFETAGQSARQTRNAAPG